jgi:parallel beta-helix repeat protein
MTTPAGQRYNTPYTTAFDTTGVVSPGAKLNFYLTGTSTRANTYSNAALTIANANPVQANGAGLFGNIYLSPGQQYKVVLTDSDDNEIWTADPVVSSGSGSFITAIATIADLRAITASLSAAYGVVMVEGYYAAGDFGPAEVFVWSAASVAVDNGVTVINPTGNVSSGRWLLTFNSTLSVLQGGAKGDGSTDDTARIQACLGALPNGGNLVFPWGSTGVYNLTNQLTITKGVRISSPVGATIKQTAAGKKTFNVTSSNVSFDGLIMTGFQNATWNVLEDLIYISGTFNAGLAPTYISNFGIKNCKFLAFGSAAVHIQYASNIIVDNNTIDGGIYIGVGLDSCSYFTISNNLISDISGVGVPVVNAYGIYASRLTDDSGELVSQPRSQYGAITGNVVRKVPTWEGLDTHGGDNIVFTGNTVYQCKFGIAVGASKNSAGTYTYAPTNCTVSGNVVNSSVTDGSAQYGIAFTGAPSSENATGCVNGNTVTGYGDSTSATIPAIYIATANGVAVSGNSVYYPGAVGIYAMTCGALSIVGNSIVDPWTNTGAVGDAVGIRIGGDNNSVHISGNSIMHIDKTATYLLTTATGKAIRYDNGGSGNAGSVGNFMTNATTPIVDGDGILSAFQLLAGTGAPGSTALKGTIYCRRDGSAVNNRAYINTDGGTSWTYLTTGT